MMGDQVQWEQKSKTISVTSKYILVKAKYKNSEYWVNKINGDLYFVVGSNLPKKNWPNRFKGSDKNSTRLSCFS